MSKLIATFFYVGLVPFAPGTFGSLAALPVWIALNTLGGWLLVVVGIILSFVVGIWATGVETHGTTSHDPGSIVIDEVAGQWLALLPISLSLVTALPLFGAIFAGFAFFRLFDILKPWPVSWADNMETPFGVMLDDIFAGALAAISLIIIATIWSTYHG